MRNFITIIIAVATSLWITGCSCNPTTSQTVEGEKVSTKIEDWKAYNLGAEHAKEIILIAHDEDALQDALLEVRARITNIHTKLGAQSANDYERGFEECIRTEKDSLARIIF
ncbi:MAG: hypothetical protein NC221_00180 [Duncaniella sp.]|nr:hypothetical protein [Muribaculum sp.]MCM1254525.1 hypothetical protein [Duncaniella sp.]